MLRDVSKALMRSTRANPRAVSLMIIDCQTKVQSVLRLNCQRTSLIGPDPEERPELEPHRVTVYPRRDAIVSRPGICRSQEYEEAAPVYI